MILLKILNEKMKKVLFLMLFLIVLGTASVKAQVRIGGNAAPNASAVLDLNANDTNNGTKGLALPRVGLTSNTMLLPGVTSNLTGMLVYNTTTTGGAGVNTIGIYFWNGATWVKASLPTTTPADSGKFLVSNGSAWVASYIMNTEFIDTVHLTIRSAGSYSLTKILDTMVTFTTLANRPTRLRADGMTFGDICISTTGTILHFATNPNVIWVWWYNQMPGTSTIGIRCFRIS